MRLKSYFANTIEEAIRQARRELGPEAMLVNSKRAGAEAQHLGAYEVVACTEAPEVVMETSASRDAERRNPSPMAADQLTRDVSDLKQQMEKLALTLARSTSGMAGIAFDAELSRAFASLTDAEFDTELAYDLLSQMSSPVSQAALRASVKKLLHVDTKLGCPGAPQQIVAVAGPPGSGKTSALVKLAVQRGSMAQKSIQVLTTDTYRIAAADELRSYAAILGAGFQVVETPELLQQSLRECRHKDLVLIDTPGLSRRDMEIADGWAKALTADPNIDTNLVLSASMRAADQKRIAAEYGIFQPRKLLFTRVDETETFGPILSLSIRMQKAISFLSSGQRIPEDLSPASVETLLDLMFGSAAVQAPSAEPDARYGAVAA